VILVAVGEHDRQQVVLPRQQRLEVWMDQLHARLAIGKGQAAIDDDQALLGLHHEAVHADFA
jgi:hypothetical protein